MMGLMKIRSLLFGVFVFFAGCFSYPLNMTEKEWNALTPKQQADARERQKEVYRYEADAQRCHRGAERKVVVKFPAGGLQLNSFGSSHQGGYEISMGEDGEFYRQCMEKAGWDVRLFIDITCPKGR